MHNFNANNKPFSPSHSGRSDVSIGKLLLDMGKIKPADAEIILRIQKTEGLRFGDVALRLGLISESDIQQALAMQFDYPYLQTGQRAFSKDLVAAYQPFSSQVEALRALRGQLMVRWFNESHKTLAVMSTNAFEGRSNLSANLAVVFSQLGERTLLIDANLRSPSQHKIFNLTQRRGLSDILVGRAGLEVVTKIEDFVDLSVLSAGTIPPNPQELLSRSNFNDFINQVAINFDVVILDTAPASETTEAFTVAGKCGGALLVSRLNQTSLSDLKNIKEHLKSSGIQIISAVVTDF